MSGKSVVIAAVAILVSLSGAGQLHGQETSQAVMDEGRELYLQHCEYCHGKGIGRGATVILDARYGDTQLGALEERTNLQAEFIRTYVRNWTPGMASFRPSEISDDQLDVLVTWLTRNNPD